MYTFCIIWEFSKNDLGFRRTTKKYLIQNKSDLQDVRVFVKPEHVKSISSKKDPQYACACRILERAQTLKRDLGWNLDSAN